MVCLLIAFLFFLGSPAQEVEQKFLLGLHVGMSVTGGAIRALDQLANASVEQETNVSVSPAGSVTFDYFILKLFTFGVLISNQCFKGQVLNYEFEKPDGSMVNENVSFNLNRKNISIVPQFHYPVKGTQLDLYSGIRVGY